MIVTFKNTRDAAVLIAKNLGGTVEGSYTPIISIGKDANIRIQSTGDSSTAALRATVYSGNGGYSSSKHGWTSIKIKEVRENKPNTYRQTLDHYEGDIDALVAKIKPLLEPLKGHHERETAAQELMRNTATTNREARRPFVDRLIELGLACRSTSGENHRQDMNTEDARAESHPDRKYRIDCRATEIRLTADIPYDKAERILAILKEELG